MSGNKWRMDVHTPMILGLLIMMIATWGEMWRLNNHVRALEQRVGIVAK